MTADEPMSTPDSGGLRAVPGLAEHEVALRDLWRDLAEKNIEMGTDWPFIARTLYRDIDRLLAAHPELVPTPDSAARGRVRRYLVTRDGFYGREAGDDDLIDDASYGGDDPSAPLLLSDLRTLTNAPPPEHYDDRLAPDSADDATVGERKSGPMKPRPHHWINQNGRCDGGQMMDEGDDWVPVYVTPPETDVLIDALRVERNRAVQLAEERESDYLAEVADHEQTKRLLAHSQRVAGKAIQRAERDGFVVDTRPPPRPIPGVPATGSPRPCRRRWCRGRDPHSAILHWLGWLPR